MNSRISRKIKKQMFVLVSGGHIGAPQRDNQLFLIKLAFFD